jgi:ABC-2 type transport system ATP-binding protein
MIRTRALTRHFRAKGETVEAVRGIDLDVGAGELVAFLGPNGAGKSTTLRMLTTLLLPTSGTAEVVGRDVERDPGGVRRRIGFIGQGNGAAHNQRVRDELVVQGRIFGLGRAEARARSDELLAALDLTELAGRAVSSLSGGQQRRVDIALGMVHRPELLFLDEPSTGLDPQNRANLAGLIERLRSEHGTTIVLTTHYLDEADSLADRVIVIDHGDVIADDTPQRLKDELAGDHVAITVADAAHATIVAGALERTGVAQDLVVAGRSVDTRVRGGSTMLPGLLRDLDRAGVVVAAAEVARPTLDDVFLTLTGRSLRDGASGTAEPDPAGLGTARSTGTPRSGEPVVTPAARATDPSPSTTRSPDLQEVPS